MDRRSCRWSRVPVVSVLEGNPTTDTRQQVIKLGPAQSEVPLKVPVIQAQLLEELVKLTKLAAPHEESDGPRHGAERVYACFSAFHST